MKKDTKLRIFIETLKFFCFLGFIVSIYEDNIWGGVFWGFTTILSILIKEWSLEI